ncbi:DUF6602 domain-containing protein [Collimonas silvisoli]|uniref:DUF6602 domain-containing protein n=1 Tax=Collimonas silvisoli TaxID=2825884 RepID=UPI001B8C348F|nr:DUF6602 domain-containing protein [Collimonas silvisoli]
MADKNQYQAFVRAKIGGAIAEARAASSLKHQGVKGTVLEILVARLFRPLLPSDIGIGSGQIIDQMGGNMSTQIDIILYDKSILPPALYDDSTGIFPIEAVLYAIEVKTTLTAKDLAIAHDSATALRSFGYLPGLKNDDGTLQHHTIQKVRSVVFALGSDLSGKALKECLRYEKVYNRKQQSPVLAALCVVGREYSWNQGEHWVIYPGTEDYDEVLSFIGGVTNSYREVARSRHYPKLGNYLIPRSSSLSLGPRTSPLNRVVVTCETCGGTGRLRPKVPSKNLTVKGTISKDAACSRCGGKMTSAPGEYEFVDGELINGDPFMLVDRDSNPEPDLRIFTRADTTALPGTTNEGG